MTTGRDALTIPLQGGLGNQLFELAAGLALATRLRRAIVYSDYWLGNPGPDETPRAFALDGLISDNELVHEPVRRTGNLGDRLLGSCVVERGPADDALARVRSRTRIAAGYFQRLAYVRSAWPDLRSRLAMSSRPAHRRLLETPTSSSGALHYRLGDYLTSRSANAAHGVTSPEYFAAVIREGRDSLGISDWTVVSDDPRAAVELLRSTDLPTDIHLRTSDDGDDWSDLAALASARICAISNSSFSWWAAFIGSNVGSTTVVAPRPWFADGTAPEPAIIPDTWLRRDRKLMA